MSDRVSDYIRLFSRKHIKKRERKKRKERKCGMVAWLSTPLVTILRSRVRVLSTEERIMNERRSVFTDDPKAKERN